MFSNLAFNSLVLASSVLTSTVIAAPQNAARQSSSNLSLTAKLLLADGAADRYALLPNDVDYIYNFNTAPPILPSRKSFPALTGTGVSMAFASFPRMFAPDDACSIGPLHIHPRATEIFLVVSGQIHSVHVPELGAGPIPANQNGSSRVLNADLTTGMMTVFPQGAFHTTWNPTCENATAAAAFSSDDEGFVGILPNLFSLNDGVIEDLVGGSLDAMQIQIVREALSAAGSSVKECKVKCGLE